MTLTKTLKLASIALPGLVALPAGANWAVATGWTNPAPFNYFADTDGLTEAEFTNGVATTIGYKNVGRLLNGTIVTIDSGSAANVTYYIESYNWDSAVYNVGQSHVQDNTGNDNFYAATAEVHQ